MEGIKDKIRIMEDIHSENNSIAKAINKLLSNKGIFTINVMGAPGSGKTSALKQLIKALPDVKHYVIEGDIESDIDAEEIKRMGIETYQINTFGACHLDAPLIEIAVSQMGLAENGVLYIENIGNLVCPAEFNIGEHIKLLICSVTDGGDKPYKYPLAFEKADIILLNKMDLVQYLDFDEDFFMKGVRRLNKSAPVFKTSCRSGDGFEDTAAHIKSLFLKHEI